MSAVTLHQQPPNDVPPRKRFTRAEIEQTSDAGLFVGQRFELIDGDLIDKMGQKPPHATCIQVLLELLAQIFGLQRIRTRLPIEVANGDQETNMPEPDLAVINGTFRMSFRDRHPRGSELLLVVEVSDTTFHYDASKRRDLYARAAVNEYWVVDIKSRRLLIHRGLASGQYHDITTLNTDSFATIPTKPDVRLPVSQMFFDR